MNKSAIQKYAIWARNELIDKVTLKAFEYGVSKDEIIDANADSVNGKILTSKEKSQRQQLISKVNELGFDETIEEVAYTWFNRFIALRFMEVNNYLPTRIRVFTNENNEYKPEILKEALNLEFYGLDKQYIFSCIQENKDDELYKYLLIIQCNDMGKYLPGMFTKISDYKVLLFPDNLLREDSVLGRLISDIDEDSWLDQVQIIGWLYQFYNTELKDKVFLNLKKNIKISKDNISAATQLFTPDWIVHYMVENSLGRFFINKRQNEGVFADGCGEDEMSFDEMEEKRISNEKCIADSMGWKYFLPELKQTEEVRQQLNEINKQFASKEIQDIKVIDPCMGSGHILVYVFDVLMQIYEASGWTQRDAAISILENNIYGLDIDRRAYQLAYFSIMMKARSYNRRILTLGLKPNVYEIVESSNEYKTYFDGSEISKETQDEVLSILIEMHDAKEYGSLITTGNHPYDDIINELKNTDFSLFNEPVSSNVIPLIECAKVLSMKFDVTVTNPPYASAKGLNPTIKKFIAKEYSEGKYDLFGSFFIRCINFTNNNWYTSLITPVSLLYNPSFQGLRSKFVNQNEIESLIELGSDAFEVGFGTVTFSLRRLKVQDYFGKYYDATEITDKSDFVSTQVYKTSTDFFLEFDGIKIMYKLNDNYRSILKKSKPLSTFGDARIGMQTNDNNRFMRIWHEIEYNKFCPDHIKGADFYNYKWFPIVKGGGYRKWYGNIESVVNWQYNGLEIRDLNKNAAGGRIVAEEFYFCEGLTWTHTAYTQPFSMRYMPEGTMINVEGPAVFSLGELQKYVLACLNSVVAKDIFDKVVSSIHFSASELGKFPIIQSKDHRIDELVTYNIHASQNEWDSFETSWDFTVHPLVKNNVGTVSEAYSLCEYPSGGLSSFKSPLGRIII